MSKVFISGKMTGLPNYNRDEFNRMEKLLVMMGHTVLNPACLPDGLTQNEYLQICISMLSVCDVIVMLDNWGNSKGATTEKNYADATGKRIISKETVVECVKQVFGIGYVV